MPDYKDVIVIDSDSDNDAIDELRQLAIVSMVKHEEKDPFVDNDIRQCSSESIDCHPFIPKRNKRFSTELLNENLKKIKVELDESISGDSIDDNTLLNVCKIESILNFNNCDKTRNLLKEEELKNKLLKVLSDKQRFNRINEHSPTSEFLANEICYGTALSDSDEDDFDIYTSAVLFPEVITDPDILACHNSISEVKSTIENLEKSIKLMTSSIQNNLMKSKKISTQIENLKNQKVELHKEIIVNRRKMLDLNKIKKQKSIELIKYEQKKRNLSLKRVSVVQNGDLFNSSSPVLCEPRPYDIDCNHVICSAWITNACNNKLCSYQHPKFPSKPIKMPAKSVKIKENDKVFLKEMNPTGFICKLSCDACRTNIPISSLHLSDDRFCKSCCQKLVSLMKPAEILQQLILIWHHIYKRYIMSAGLPVENRDPTILQNLYKCSEAMKIKLLSTATDIPLDLFNSAGCHVILTLNQQQTRIDDLLGFIKDLDFSPTLIRFACTLPFSIPKLYQLLIDSIEFHIGKTSRDDFHLLIYQFSEMSKSLGLSTIDRLFNWLELCIESRKMDNYCWKISVLSCAVLEEIIGSHFIPKLSFSSNDIRLGDKYWIDRKDDIFRLAKLYSSSEALSPTNPVDIPYCSWMEPTIHLLLIKFMIIAYFFTGNEDGALQICERYTMKNYFFEILLSELSLIYNSPILSIISIDGQRFDRTASLIEHTYNKSDWLLNNRSINSCIKLLESVPQILYRINHQSIPTTTKEALKFYEHFLGFGSIFDDQFVDFIPKLNENEIKSIRNNCSAIWLCYISLLSLVTDSPIDFSTVLRSDRLMSMPSNHLNRVVQFIVIQLGKRSVGHGLDYCADLRSVVMLAKDSMDFEHFIDLFQSINVDKILDCQLDLWLFLIDFCTLKFPRHIFDRFLVAISQKLLDSCRIHPNNCHHHPSRVLRHIVMCYPIRHVEVWLNFILLLLATDNIPIYELIDACEIALSQFPNCKLLWQHYYSSTVRSGDQELPKRIKSNVAKFGFELR